MRVELLQGDEAGGGVGDEIEAAAGVDGQQQEAVTHAERDEELLQLLQLVVVGAALVRRVADDRVVAAH